MLASLFLMSTTTTSLFSSGGGVLTTVVQVRGETVFGNDLFRVSSLLN